MRAKENTEYCPKLSHSQLSDALVKQDSLRGPVYGLLFRVSFLHLWTFEQFVIAQ